MQWIPEETPSISGSGAKNQRFWHTEDIHLQKGRVLGMKSQNLFKWKQYEPEMILLTVRWYLRYSLSFRNLVEMMEERGLDKDDKLELFLRLKKKRSSFQKFFEDAAYRFLKRERKKEEDEKNE